MPTGNVKYLLHLETECLPCCFFDMLDVFEKGKSRVLLTCVVEISGGGAEARRAKPLLDLKSKFMGLFGGVCNKISV